MCYKFYILCAATFPFQNDDFISIDEIVSLYLFPSCIYIIIINSKKKKKNKKIKKKIKKKKQRPVCKSWVKLSKVMPQSQVHSPGKGREALRQKS